MRTVRTFLLLLLALSGAWAGNDNVPPVAVTGPNRSTELGQAVSLRGTSSDDPDDDAAALTMAWTQVAGPSVPLSNAAAPVASFTPQVSGEYTFRLNVEDPDGASDTDEVLIYVPSELDDIRDGLVARWSFEEGEGELALDSSASGITGRLGGATRWTDDSADTSDWGVEFPGGGDDVVSLGGFDVTGSAMSITLWFRADDFDTGDARLISKATGSPDQEHYWMVSTLSNGELRFRLRTAGSTTTLISPSGVVSPGSWFHVAAVYDGSEMRILRNGAEVAATSKSGSLDSNPAVLAAIGNQPLGVSGGRRPFDGLIDEVRIYDRALSTADVGVVMAAEHRIYEEIGFNTWARNRALNGPARDLEGDADEDGISLRLEYAFGMDPKRPDTLPFSLEQTTAGTLDAVFQVSHTATDLTFFLQGSGDGSDWSNLMRYEPIGSGVTRTRFGGGDEPAAVTIDHDGTRYSERFLLGSRQFLRLWIER